MIMCTKKEKRQLVRQKDRPVRFSTYYMREIYGIVTSTFTKLSKLSLLSSRNMLCKTGSQPRTITFTPKVFQAERPINRRGPNMNGYYDDYCYYLFCYFSRENFGVKFRTSRISPCTSRFWAFSYIINSIVLYVYIHNMQSYSRAHKTNGPNKENRTRARAFVRLTCTSYIIQ